MPYDLLVIGTGPGGGTRGPSRCARDPSPCVHAGSARGKCHIPGGCA